MQQEHQHYPPSPSMEGMRSPTLEALYNDLDMFINELSVNSSTTATEACASSTDLTTNRSPTSSIKRRPASKRFSRSGRNTNKDVTPLTLDQSMMDYATNGDEYDESPGYSPVLDDYTRASILPTSPTIIEEEPAIKSMMHRTPSTSSSNSSHSPSNSPSFLKASVNGDYFSGTPNKQQKDEFVFTTRSSSLNRAASSVSGKSILNKTNPTSPLAFDITRSMHQHLEEDEDYPNHALLSFIASQFTNEVIQLNKHRKIFCTDEYPLSFSGEEALDILKSFLPDGLGNKIYLDIAQCLMYCKPKLIGPIAYSEKSLRKNKLYNSASEVYTIVEESMKDSIQGIYTPLTRCYSTSCLPGQPGCYSAFCPNQMAQLDGRIIKKPAVSVMSSSSHDTALSRAWSATVSKDVLKQMADDDIKRQEAIHEIIYTEEDYVRDLKILDQDFAKELLASQCIEESRKREFHDNVLNNYQEILEIHDSLYKELRDHQDYCIANNRIAIIDKIGDIFLRHIHRFMNAYVKYGPHVVLAEYAAKIESENNMIFKQFIKTKEQLAQCRRLPFRHFIILPVTRLQRYSLLLGAVLKKTPADNPDKEYLTKCIEIIKNVAGEMDKGTLVTKNKLRILEIETRIRFKPQEYHDLDLKNPIRKLLKEGVLTRKSHLAVETTELHVFLFDHLFLMTKVRKSATKHDDIEYHISKRPIPMELLQVAEGSEGFSIGLRNMTSTYNTATSINVTTSSSPFGQSFPIVVQHLGRHGNDYLLYAENAQTRLEWKEKLVEAKASRETLNVEKQIFEIRSLSDTTFSMNSGQHNHGKVTCTVPFVGPTGIRMIAVGTQQGIWMGIEGDTNTIKQVLTLSDVQQVAVLEDHHIFLVLADKTLYAYTLDSLLPNANRKPSLDKAHQKIAQHISFFHSGVCNGRTIVIAMKKRGVDSNFKVFEPICGDLRDPKNSKFFSKSGIFSKMPSWFKSYTEFYIGTESYAMHFLKARVVVVCARGFEIINLEALNMNRNLPDPTNPEFAFIQRDDLKPLGMYRCREHYLLCYDQFAFMVNMHGGLVKDVPLIEWEGVPQSVAFYYPYVVGFDPRFIEVRHVETGELIQVLAGTHMRCLQFINQSIAPVIHGCMAHPFRPDFQYIFQLAGTFEPPI